MGVKISQLDPLTGGLTKYDKFEVEKNSDGKSYSATGEDIKNYVKKINNGSFMGTVSKSADEFTIADVGVWNWSGSDGPERVGGGYCTTGIMEIISYVEPEEVGQNAYTIIQRLTYGSEVYQRVKTESSVTTWSKLSTRNTVKILYGTSTSTSVSFPSGYFSSTPCVTVTPVANNSNAVYAIKISELTVSGFSVQKHVSSIVAAVVNETSTENTTVTENTGAGTKTTQKETTNKTETTRGEWQVNSEMGFTWIAVHDEN